MTVLAVSSGQGVPTSPRGAFIALGYQRGGGTGESSNGCSYEARHVGNLMRYPTASLKVSKRIASRLVRLPAAFFRGGGPRSPHRGTVHTLCQACSLSPLVSAKRQTHAVNATGSRYAGPPRSCPPWSSQSRKPLTCAWRMCFNTRAGRKSHEQLQQSERMPCVLRHSDD